MKKVLKIILGILIVPYLVIVIFLTICLLNYNDYNITELGNKSLIIINDNELEPNYKKNDLIVVEKNDYANVKNGNMIFFYDNYRNKITVNYGKVIDAEKITDDEYTFTVEGDHPISSEFFIGKSDTSRVYSGLGGIINTLESRWGYLFVVVFPILVIFIYEIYAVVMEVKKPLEDE